MITKPLGTSTHHINAHTALILLLSLPTDPSRRIPIQAAVSPQRLTLLNESHLEKYFALVILSLETKCAYRFYTLSADGSQTLLSKFR